jgi:hypothetical protein
MDYIPPLGKIAPERLTQALLAKKVSQKKIPAFMKAKFFKPLAL